MKLPILTKKQQEILKLLYKYRFLNRIQIQALLNHKDRKTINMWLRDLKEKHYVERIYNPDDFAERTKPAIYYLGINGIRKQKDYDLPIEEIRKRYRDSSRSQTFIDRCLLITNCAIVLEQTETKDEDVVTNYFFETEADYMSDTYFGFLVGNELIHPQLCYQKLVHNGSDEPYPAASYLLEIFDPTFPRYRIKKRLANYVQYLDEEGDDWKNEIDTKNLPIIQLVCPRTTDLIYAKRRTRGLIADIWEYDDEGRGDIHIQFTTMAKLQEHGVLDKEIWEEA